MLFFTAAGQRNKHSIPEGNLNIEFLNFKFLNLK